MHELATSSRLLVEALYTLIILLAAGWTAYSSRRLYQLSGHRGLQLFSSAFLFAMIGFLLRLVHRVLEAVPCTFCGERLLMLIVILYYYALSMFGFLLAYSLVWHHFDAERGRVFLLHGLSLLIAIFGVLKENEYVFFLPQFGALGYAIFLSYQHYRKRQRPGQQMFLIALILAFIGYFTNFLVPFVTPFFHTFTYYVYGVTALVFLLIAVTVQRVTHRG